MESHEPRKDEQSKTVCRFALLALIILFTLNNYNFIKYDQSPPFEETHFGHIYQLYQAPSPSLWFYEYPPLQYAVSLIFVKTFGFSIPSILWSLYPFCLIYILSVYFLGEHFGGPEGGLAAALIATATPLFLDLSHRYILEMTQTSMIIATLLFLIKSEKFKNVLFSYLFGISFALAMLIKWSSIFFLLVPVLIQIWALLREKTTRMALLWFITVSLEILGCLALSISPDDGTAEFSMSRESIFALCLFIALYLSIFIWSILIGKKSNAGERISPAINFIRSAVVSAILFIPYYLAVGPRLLFFLEQHKAYMRDYWTGNDTIGAHINSAAGQAWNLLSAFPFLVPMLFAGLIFMLLKKQKFFDWGLLASMFAFGFLCMDLTTPLWPRYVLPLVPILAIMAGYWTGSSGYAKLPVMSMIAAYAILSLSFPFFSPQVEYVFKYPIQPQRGGLLDPSPVFPMNPSKEGLHIQDISRDIIELARKSEKKDVTILLITTRNYGQARDFGIEPGIKMEHLFLVISLMDEERRLSPRFFYSSVAFMEDFSDMSKILRDLPGEAAIALCFCDPRAPARLIRRIHIETGRNASVIKYYYGADMNKVALIRTWQEKPTAGRNAHP